MNNRHMEREILPCRQTRTLAASGSPSQTTFAAVAGISLMMGSNLLALAKLVYASSVEGAIALHTAKVRAGNLTGPTEG